MSYTDYQVTVPLAGTATASYDNAAAASGTGDKFSFVPCQSPVILRYINIVATTTKANTSAPKFSIRKNTTIGGASATGQQITTITMATGNIQGTVYYNSARMDTLIEPDEELVVAQITGSGVTGTRVRASALVEPNWDVPGNLTMTAATA